LKEATADVALLNAGIRSRAEIIAARGRDISDVDGEIQQDTFTPRATPALSSQGVLPNDAP
jgi:capsid protein